MAVEYGVWIVNMRGVLGYIRILRFLSCFLGFDGFWFVERFSAKPRRN